MAVEIYGSNPFYNNAIKAYYRLEDNGNDVIGTNNLTVTGGSYGTGIFGKGYVANGTSSHAESGNIAFGSMGAIAWWFKPGADIGTGAEPADYKYLCYPGTGFARFQKSGVGSAGLIIFAYSGGGVTGDAFKYLSGVDYLMVFDYSPTAGANIWRNGVKVASSAQNSGDNGSTPLVLGSAGEGGTANAIFDDLAVFGTPLTSAQQLNLYSGTKPSNGFFNFF
jgi:hypothetical protein